MAFVILEVCMLIIIQNFGDKMKQLKKHILVLPLTIFMMFLCLSSCTSYKLSESEMQEIGNIINLVLSKKASDTTLKECMVRVRRLTDKFPLYPELK